MNNLSEEELEILEQIRKQNLATYKLMQCILVVTLRLDKRQLNNVLKQIEKEVNNE